MDGETYGTDKVNTVTFHEYIPYGLGVMTRTRSGMDGQMDGRTGGLMDGWTDVQDGQS